MAASFELTKGAQAGAKNSFFYHRQTGNWNNDKNWPICTGNFLNLNHSDQVSKKTNVVYCNKTATSAPIEITKTLDLPTVLFIVTL